MFTRRTLSFRRHGYTEYWNTDITVQLNQTVNDGVAHSKNPRKCAYHVTFDLDLDFEHTLDARWPGVHLVKVWWRSGHLPGRRSDLRKSLQTDRRRTPRHCISSFLEWANLKFPERSLRGLTSMTLGKSMHNHSDTRIVSTATTFKPIVFDFWVGGGVTQKSSSPTVLIQISWCWNTMFYVNVCLKDVHR